MEETLPQASSATVPEKTDLTWRQYLETEAATRVAALERQVMLSPVDDEAALGETLVTQARAAGRGR